jgi:DMSO/TMAO reductase YedYZ molybdopterin-dependent catalytic subunit
MNHLKVKASETRRRFLSRLGFVGLAGAASRAMPGWAGNSVAHSLPGTSEESEAPWPPPENPLLAGRPLVRYPEKTDLILLTSRPPQLETPMKYFESAVTPTEAFYVRYHIYPPTEVDLATWRLKVSGQVEKPLQLSLDDLETRFTPVKLVAVNQCSGNSRGHFAPRVFGGQWSNGAMGNAEWTGVRLQDVMKAAGIKTGTVDVSFNGLDTPPSPTVPDFEKSLTVKHIMSDPDVLIAYAMNGRALPLLNGFPARLIVPGWYATYWVKNLSNITVLDHAFDGFWMRKAYLIPDTPCGCIEPGAAAANMVPITRMNTRSFIISPAQGTTLDAGRGAIVKGIAFDGGYGIEQVLLSTDKGTSWQAAELGQDLGKYSFRQWTFPWTPPRAGLYRLLVRATNRIGESQPLGPLWSPAGYMRNVVEHVDVRAV